jgi:hypothetical protein
MGSLVLALSLSQSTCRLDQLISPSTAAVRLTLAADTVGIADTARLVAIVTVDGKQSRALRVEWSTDAPGFATVDTLGLVRGVARGTAKITALVENSLFLPARLEASANVKVVVPVLELVADSSILKSVGDTVCVTPTARDKLGADLGLAPDSLRPDSVFTAAGTKGTAQCFLAPRSGGPVTFRAWLDTASARTTVTIRQVAETLSVAPDSVHFKSITQRESLTVTAADRRGNPIASPTLVWTSVDTTVTVSPTGVVTAGFNGATWVRAADTAGTARDSARVVVRQGVRRVVVTPETDTLTSVGARRILQATAQDSLGQPIADAAFSWSSLAPNTVRLVADSNSARAVFEAAAEGSASIDVRSAAGDSVADTLARLEVQFALTAVTITPTRPTLARVGDTLRFSAVGRDANDSIIANLRVTWSSSAPTRISIDPVSGLATAHDVGTAVIRGRHASGAQDTTTATDAPPVLETESAIFSDSAVRGSTTPVLTTRLVRDSGTVPLGAKVRLARSSSWLSVTPDTVDLLAGESKSLQLTANPTGLADGLYSDTVVLEASGAAGSPDRIPVAFRIYCPVTAITPDTVVAGSLASGDCLARHRPSGNADFYGFSGNAGDTVTATLSVGGGASADPFLFLLGPAGGVLISNDDCVPSTRNSCVTGFVLPATGGYTLEATTFSPATGGYTLTLSRLATPAAPTALAQLKPNGAAIPSGGTNEFTSAVFRATGQDANPFDTLRLQIEVRPIATVFTGPTHTGTPTPNTSGVTLSASAGLTNDTTYHWRARTCDQTNRCGAWTAFPATPAFTVSATGPVLTVTPDAFRDSAIAGSTTPIAKSLTIDNTAIGTINWSVTKRSTWLSLGSTTGSAPPSTVVTLTLNPTGLAAGVYVDTVIVDGGAALGSPDTTFVTFVIEQPPVLTVSPAAINRAANANSGVTFNDTLGISNSGTGALAWTAIADSTWVILDKTSGSAPDKLPLRIVPGSRAAGTYTARVVISSVPAGATGSPDTTLVTLTVFQPVLAVNPASVTDSANYGSTTARDTTLQVTNPGGGTLTWSAAESPDTTWLSILPPPSGSAPGTVTLRLDPNPGGQLLAPGTHSGTVVFTSPEAINDPINVAVQFVIHRPILNVTPDSVFDTVTVGATTPRTIPVSIANGNGGTLAWTAGDSAPTSSWLSLSPPSLGAPGTLTVTLDPENLFGGVYRDTVVIRSDSATGSPRRLPVRFDVLRLPDPPTSLGQFRTGGSPIAVAGVTTETSVVFKATVTDGDPGDALRLELQVEKVGTTFNATAAVSAPVANGQTATVTFGAPFEDNSGYHWRVRTCDQTNRCSAWVSFGSGNPETAADFFANPVPQDPGAPTQLNQFQANGTTPITPGGTAGSTSVTVVLKGLVTDPDPGDAIWLEVEVKATTTPGPDGTGVQRGATSVSTNGTASVTVTGLTGAILGTNYYWRARACDQTGLCGGWVDFGSSGNVSGGVLSPAGTDFRVNP